MNRRASAWHSFWLLWDTTTLISCDRSANQVDSRRVIQLLLESDLSTPIRCSAPPFPAVLRRVVGGGGEPSGGEEKESRGGLKARRQEGDTALLYKLIKLLLIN